MQMPPYIELAADDDDFEDEGVPAPSAKTTRQEKTCEGIREDMLGQGQKKGTKFIAAAPCTGVCGEGGWRAGKQKWA